LPRNSALNVPKCSSEYSYCNKFLESISQTFSFFNIV